MMNCVKKIVQVSFIGLMVLTLASCGNQQTSSSHSSGYDSSISKGLNAVADNKYDKALTYFDNALTQKPNDKKAQAYHDQTQACLKTQTQF